MSLSTSIMTSLRISSRYFGRRIFKLANDGTMISSTRKVINFPTLIRNAKVLFTSSFVLQISMFKFNKQCGPDKETKKLMDKADELYSKGDYVTLKQILSDSKVENDEILWRLARATFEVSKTKNNKEEKAKDVEEALAIVTKALEINENNGYAHKWYAIVLNNALELRGIKEKLLGAPKIKEHLVKATELIPDDATTLHILGVWCYSVTDISWWERQLASKLFAKLPESSYEEALKYFEKAENMSPLFYNSNLLYLGKTFIRLNQMDKAKDYLIQARDYPQEKPDDKKVHEEAVLLLTRLGVK